MFKIITLMSEEEFFDKLAESNLLDAFSDVCFALAFIVMCIFLVWLSKYVKKNEEKNHESENEDIGRTE